MKVLFDWLFGRVDSRDALGVAGSRESGSGDYSPDRKLSFDETVSQMARGYENTQRVIQFMDAKAGAVVALSIAIFAFVGKVFAWAFEEWDAVAMRTLPGIFCVLLILGILVLGCGFLSLTYAFLTVRPNHLPNSEAFSTLFPAHSEDGEDEAKRRLRPIVAGADCEFAVDEYRRQLLAVGKLVHRKINWLRISIHWLWCQGLASVLFGCVILWMGISGRLVNEPKASEDDLPGDAGAYIDHSSHVAHS
ncbi:MAG: hypothetical protein MUF31_12270 [Akkermansiaceae bacterium]|jgi:hypothetical protein|nr:hypothetical protein [Akkermansiaceae bacterium]